MKLLNIFFLYSILGHLFETIVSLLSPGESGILYGFWTPIYGFGAIIILELSKFIQRYLKQYSWKYYICLFFCSFIGLTFIEWSGGVLIEKLFQEELWNYSDFPLSMGPYINPIVSLLWGIGSLILVRFIQPFFEKILSYIPTPITALCLVLFFLDTVFTIVTKVL